MKHVWLVVCALIALVSHLAAQEPAEQPMTAAYACDGTPPQREPLAYDGTAPEVSAVDVGNLNLLHIPQVINSAYFSRAAQGAEEVSRLLGTITMTTDAPTRMNAAQQARILRNYFNKVQNGVLIAPISAELAAILSELIASGVWVVAYELDPGPEARAWFVEAAEPNALAYVLGESLARQLGGEGRFAVLSAGHAAWEAELQAYLEQCYPDLTWLETVVVADEYETAVVAAAELIATHGDDLDAIVALDSLLLVGAGQAVIDTERCPLNSQTAAARSADQVVVVAGVGRPDDVRALIESGCASELVTWDPQAVGAVALEALVASITGALQPNAERFETQRLGPLEVVGSVIKMGLPLVITAETIADFEF
ncbi:substrate-binding domain-containing protein [Aggregatilineales bacterium SYSU G02658]